jgi:hypothetical protein
MPFVEIRGNGESVPPAQIGLTGVNVGTIGASTVKITVTILSQPLDVEYV